jgi:hypothetical protein
VVVTASAWMVLFAGQSLDGWITLAGRWSANQGAMVCQATPASIRSSFESDRFILQFDYRHAGRGENRLAVHSKMTTGGSVLSLTSHGATGLVTRTHRPDWPSDEWIRVIADVAPEGLHVTSFPASWGTEMGASSLAPRSVAAASDQAGSAKRKKQVVPPIPSDIRGFLRFEATEPGLEIRDIRVEEPGFANMFDGHSLHGWEIARGGDPGKPGWSVQNDVVRCRGAGSGWLRTLRTYDNFVIRLEYRLPTRGNSGIYLRAPIEGRVSRIGLEVQLLDDYPFRNSFKPAQFAGSVYDGIPPEIQVPAPADEWNAIEVLLDGKHIRTTLNSVGLYDASLDDAAKDTNHEKRPLATRHTVGFIGLQEHSTPVMFRHVRIRELP